MTSSSETDLAPIWADATPLGDYLDLKMRTPLLVGDQDLANGASTASSALLGLSAAFQAFGSTPWRMEKAKQSATNDLISGRISAIGRKENSKRFLTLEASHWIGSEIHWYSNAMTCGRVTYVDIRIVEDEQSSASQSQKCTEYRETSDVVKAAILKYAADDPNLSAKPDIRHRAYREFIREQGFDPHKQRGFGEKTFEVYETEFRKKTRAK